jgi:hypothetical protein
LRVESGSGADGGWRIAEARRRAGRLKEVLRRVAVLLLVVRAVMGWRHRTEVGSRLIVVLGVGVVPRRGHRGVG